MSKKILQRFPSLLEAEAAVTCLNSAGIFATIDNEVVGSMMPHASNALGGFIVSIDSENEATAKELLRGIDESAEAPDATQPSGQTKNMMKRAAYGAVLGMILLPLIANAFSLKLYASAHRLNPKIFWEQKSLLVIGLIFNLIGILEGIFFGLLLAHQLFPNLVGDVTRIF